MVGCELCGTETDLVTAIVEGSALLVCKPCSRFGTIVERPVLPSVGVQRQRREEETKEYVVEHCGVLVKRAREQKGILQDDLGRAVGEKASVIHKIENGHLRPNTELARKLERFLGFHRIEARGVDDLQPKVKFSDQKLTIGDILKLKQKTSS